jgi:type I restriction enzyme S subunit
MNYEDWRQENLDDLCSLIADCPHSTPKWMDEGVFVIRSWNVRRGMMNFDKISFTDEASYQGRIRRAQPTTGDIVITREAPMGEVAMIPDGLKCCLGQRLVLLKPDAKKINNRYLLYSLQSHYVQSQILSNEGTGSTVSNLRIPDLKGLKIPVPKLEQQEKIASILSSLDDKIELNRQTNKTLEAIAQALFKEWFVDFNFPGATGEMQESELGEIPKGWRVGRLFDICRLVGGGTPKTSVSEYWVDGNIPWISAKDVTPNNGTFIIETDKKITELGLQESSAKLLPKHSTIITARGTVGNYCIIPEPMAISQSNYALVSKYEKNAYFLFCLVGSLITELKQRSYGTVFDTITTNSLSDIPIVKPAEGILDKFQKTIRPIFESILELQKQIYTLTQLRDSLLPKLMKGEIDL